MKETKLEYIKRRLRWKVYYAKSRISNLYYSLFFGYYIVSKKLDDRYRRWYTINKKCYGVDSSKEMVETIYSVFINTGTILKPRFEFFCDSSCKSDAIARVKSFKKNKPLNTTCKNELMFTNQNTKDFHHFLLEESKK